MRLERVTLRAPQALLPELAAFYGAVLGLPASLDGGLAVEVGETRLAFVPGEGRPYYHVALLVPGDRWVEALAWARARIELLPDPATDEPVFDFDSWGARAVYCHDPAGSIVELIAHAGLAPNGRSGPFGAEELVGLSEVGLVGDTAALATALHAGLGLELWDGVVGVGGRLGFVGEKGRTLILCPPGRGWLPTGRPAEAHPLELELAGCGRTGSVVVGSASVSAG